MAEYFRSSLKTKLTGSKISKNFKNSSYIFSNTDNVDENLLENILC